MRFRKFQTAARWSGAWNDLSALPTAGRNWQARDTLEHPLPTVNQKYKRPATLGQSQGRTGGIGQRFHKVACKFAVAFWFAGVAKVDTCGFDECRLPPRCSFRNRLVRLLSKLRNPNVVDSTGTSGPLGVTVNFPPGESYSIHMIVLSALY